MEFKLLYNRSKIISAVIRLTGELDDRMRGAPEDYVALVVMNGGFMFAADLLRSLSDWGYQLPTYFINASSYYAATIPVGVSVDDPHYVLHRSTLEGKRVIVIDDIIDRGATMRAVKERVLACGALSVCGCVLLDKPAHRVGDSKAEHVGLTIPDVFVVGYGMGHGDKYRGLAEIRILEE